MLHAVVSQRQEILIQGSQTSNYSQNKFVQEFYICVGQGRFDIPQTILYFFGGKSFYLPSTFGGTSLYFFVFSTFM